MRAWLVAAAALLALIGTGRFGVEGEQRAALRRVKHFATD